jgi:hypothetical protein
MVVLVNSPLQPVTKVPKLRANHLCVWLCVCVCARAQARVRVCVRACLRVCTRPCESLGNLEEFLDKDGLGTDLHGLDDPQLRHRPVHGWVDNEELLMCWQVSP